MKLQDSVSAGSVKPLESAVHLSIFSSTTDLTSLQAKETSWAAVVETLASPKAWAKKKSDLPLLKLAKFGNKRTERGGLRHNDNVLSITGIEADYDQEILTVEQVAQLLSDAGAEAVVYSSPSHMTKTDTARGGPRCRIVCPLSKEYPPEARREFVGRLNRVLGGVLAVESFVLSQTFFYGRVEGVPYEAKFVSGACLDELVIEPLYPDQSTTTPSASGDVLMDYTPPHGVSEYEVRALLDQLDPDMGRDPWLKVGMGLHHEFSGSIEGFEYWDEWSRKSAKYNAGQPIERVWESFKNEGRVITMGTIKQMVADSVVDLDTPEIVPDHSLKLKATEWVVSGFMSTGLTVIAGRAGGGKTSSLVSMFAQVAHLCAPDAMLRPTLRRHIVYMAEDVEQVKRCLYGLLKHGESGLTEQEFLDWFHIIPSRRVSAQALANKIKKCNEQYSYTLPNGFVVKPVLIADTANATLDLENENDNSEVGRAVAILKQALDGMALVVVAHTAKSLVRADLSEMSPRGASAWIGDANATIYAFEDVKLPRARFLGLGKHRFEPEMGEIGFESTVYHEHVYAAWGESQVVKYRVSTPMRSSAEVREQAREAAHDEAEVARFAKQRTAVFDALRDLGGGEYLTKNELREDVLKGQTKKRAADLDALIEAEFIVKITPSEGGYARRNNAHKEGFVLCDEARAQAWTGGENDLV